MKIHQNKNIFKRTEGVILEQLGIKQQRTKSQEIFNKMWYKSCPFFTCQFAVRLSLLIWFAQVGLVAPRSMVSNVGIAIVVVCTSFAWSYELVHWALNVMGLRPWESHQKHRVFCFLAVALQDPTFLKWVLNRRKHRKRPLLSAGIEPGPTVHASKTLPPCHWHSYYNLFMFWVMLRAREQERTSEKWIVVKISLREKHSFLLRPFFAETEGQKFVNKIKRVSDEWLKRARKKWE